MIGLFLALLYAGVMSIKGLPNLAILSQSSNFLFWWYIIWSVIQSIPVLFFLFILTLGTTAMGAGAGYDSGRNGAVLGGLIGLLLGGSLSLLAVTRFAIKRMLLILGSYLLSKSVFLDSSLIGNGQLDKQKFTIGLLLLATSLIILRPKISSTRTTSATTTVVND